jgi:UDP-N-acetylmuramoylalanine--D-glutamate ligase
MPVPGEHNIANALAAACVGAEFGLGSKIIAAGLTAFKPLPHRMEPIASVRGVDYYDDSIATTPESALLGLNSFDKPPIIILGGKDKGADFSALLTSCIKKTCGVICLGQIGQKLFARLLEFRGSVQQPYLAEVATLEQAVKAAAALAEPGQAVLLSPGCASYDMFVNFEHRGQRFAQIVRALPCE